MFTGLIEHRGKLSKLVRKENQWCLEINLPDTLNDPKISESISVNGVCLTVSKIQKNIISFDLLEETYQRTTIRYLKTGDNLNLERALKMGDRLGGHFVTGHVDGVGVIKSIVERECEKIYKIEVPNELIPYLAVKGSIAVDGVSLTLGEIKGNQFEVYLIPFTLENTNLGGKKTGDRVNLEIDVIARYVKRMMEGDRKSQITEEFLREHGYL